MLVPVADLVGSPGATRALDRTVAVEDVGDDPWGPAEDALHDELHLDLVLDSVVEGIFVRGEVAWALTMPCVRCLRDVDLDRVSHVGELFADPRRLDPDDEVDEGYELVEGASAIDLERMLHDVVVLDMPTRPECGRDDCEVPSGSDGVRFLTADEARAEEEQRVDPRWAALEELDLTQN